MSFIAIFLKQKKIKTSTRVIHVPTPEPKHAAPRIELVLTATIGFPDATKHRRNISPQIRPRPVKEIKAIEGRSKRGHIFSTSRACLNTTPLPYIFPLWSH